MARKFGIVTSLEGFTAGMVVNSLSFSESAEIAEARNQYGQVTDYASYSRAKTVNITGLLDQSKGELVKAGAKITLGTENYIIDNVSKNESNTGFVEVTISAKTADNVQITIYGGTTTQA